ncbi:MULTISPECIES: hypothetical protein [unclassified Mycolicibacterium]|uniref:hypothetical protein n=1 Tax=unclassified Mycolicibacterium TaxID=2636767 RepID=UPI001EE3F0C2|nr:MULTISPECIES: hypothetical protein [unclassified Mycolicibacterium]
MDSGDFHASSFAPGEAARLDSSVSFMTPSRNIVCTGGPGSLVCEASSRTLPRPPRPTQSPPGNWEPYVEFSSAGVTYGIAAGNPMVPSKANVLPYGSSLRLGDVECLSDTDGLTCVNFPSNTGFHLSRDDLTPLKAVEPVPADTRVEPRTPGNTYCGTIVSHAAISDAIKTLPNNEGWQWTEMGPGDYYTCHNIQLFEAGANGNGNRLPAMPAHVLVFDRGRFVGSATERPYAGLSGTLDDTDPSLIHLAFLVSRDGKHSNAPARARYENGHVTLLDPIPDGAIPAA